MKIDKIPISEIIPYKDNPRLNDKAVDIVAKSIKEFGFQSPIILDKKNEIIAGHTRLKAAQKLKLTEVPVIWAENLTDTQVKAFRIMNNKSSENAEWDITLLELELTNLDELEYDLENTGFDLREVGDILDDMETKDDGFIEVDAYERAKNKTTIKTGEIYQLGDHRLMCGDATKKEDVWALMGENKADLGLTDPPYNVGYEYASYEDNKTAEEYKIFCESFFENLISFSKFQAITPGTINLRMWANIGEWKSIAPWVKKNTMNNGEISRLRLWEPIIFYGKPEERRNTDVFEHNIKGEKISHTCPKPL